MVLPEFLACVRALTPAHRAALEAAGVPASVLDGPQSLVGAARVHFLGDDLFEPVEVGGREVIVVPAVTWRSAGWLGASPYDLIGFEPELPSRWRRYRGDAVLLGEDCLEWASWTWQPLRLHSSPLAWLAAGARGSCVVDWGANLLALLDRVPEVITDQPALQYKLRGQIQAQQRVPFRISTRELCHAGG